MKDVYQRAEVLALLQDAKERPNEDGPRLVLADFLEDHGAPERAEFIRLQCRLTSQGQPAVSRRSVQDNLDRLTELLARFGGSWAGPLWQWGGGVEDWHRGLLSLRLHRRMVLPHLEDILPWVDTVLLEAWGWQGLERAVHFLNAGTFNHVVLELRRPLLEEGILTRLAEVDEAPSLRTLTVGWQPYAWRPHAAGTSGVIGLGERFFTQLALELPLRPAPSHFVARRPLLSVLAQAYLREAGIEVVQGCASRWPSHRLPHAAFRRPA